MGVKTVKCVACLRDVPEKLAVKVTVEGNPLIVCSNPTECRTVAERNGTWLLVKVGQ